MNATVNGSSSCPISVDSTAEKIGKSLAYSLLFVVSLVGNSFIAVIVYRTQAMRKPINYFITNMAMSDLLYPIFVFPRVLTELFVASWNITGPFGQALCKLVFFLPDVSTVVSVQSLILIAVDRFGTVVFPLRSPFISSKLCIYFILFTWIVAMAVLSPYFFAIKVVEYPEGKRICQGRWSEAFGESSSEARYFLALYVVFYYIPIALLIILYSVIFYKLKSQKRPGEQSANANELRTKRNRHVLKTAIAIVVGFALCWVPWSIINLLIYFEWNRELLCGVFQCGVIVWAISQANCAINPIICFIFNSNYRQGLKKLLCFGEIQG